jgi:uncharacterized surface protein with fasciclin (FAS1) repeats
LIAAITLVALVGAACSSDTTDATPTTRAGTPTVTPPPGPTGPTTTTTAPFKPDIIGVAVSSVVFTELAGLVLDAGLVDTLRGGPFTVFAPTDDAFAKLPVDVLHAVQDDPKLLARVLTYHVVPGALMIIDLKPGKLKTVSGDELTITKDGDTTYVNGNAIAAADVEAGNGVIHVMGDVLVPPLGNIIDVATSLPGFKTLTKLVTSAKLVDTLKGKGPFTVFAPTDAAFKAVDSATLAKVQGDPQLLAKVLTYHVVAGALTTADLKDGKLKTVSGDELTITHDSKGLVLIDGHQIAVNNVEATNGIIQVMGDVLIPSN